MLHEVFALLFLSLLLYQALYGIIRRKISNSLTGQKDLLLLNKQRKAADRIAGTAVVVGGSLAGLLAARVCADHFEEVLIIEREGWLATDAGIQTDHRKNVSGNSYRNARKRVMQWPNLHAYQAMVLRTLQALFPNFQERLETIGGRYVSTDGRVHFSGILIDAPYQLYPNGILPKTIAVARSRLEAGLRNWVLCDKPNVKQLAGTATRLIPGNILAKRLDGICVKMENNGEEQSIDASLIIGPSQCGYHWLQELPGLKSHLDAEGQPFSELKLSYEVKTMNSNLEFEISDRVFDILETIGVPEIKSEAHLYAGVPAPSRDSRAFFIERVDDNFIYINPVVFGSNTKLYTIQNLRDFLSSLNYHADLPSWIFKMLDVLEEENVPFRTYHARTNPITHIRYDLAQRLPSNFIAIGDAVTHLNPVRGQGVCKICLDVISLNAALSRVTRSHGLPCNFAKELFKVLRVRTGIWWDMARDDDYAFETTTPAKGDDPHKVGTWSRAWANQFLALCIMDPAVAAIDFHVHHGFAPYTDVFSPVVIRKMIWLNLKRLFGCQIPRFY
ncbi:hypothetical protein M422DRAFT_242457 [Sphaerobolus stellatus SS14]|nr:hypothetical protein M422DRAFT_242457 [Sphaerobolus stellatus SS14]